MSAVEAFKQTDVDYLNEEKGQQKDAGSTASTAVLLGDRLLVANVGDSRVVACRDGSGLLLVDYLLYPKFSQTWLWLSQGPLVLLWIIFVIGKQTFYKGSTSEKMGKGVKLTGTEGVFH